MLRVIQRVNYNVSKPRLNVIISINTHRCEQFVNISLYKNSRYVIKQVRSCMPTVYI